MTQASDQSNDSDGLSPNARRMLALRDAVLQEWGRRVRAALTEAARLPQPILVNTFPTLYDDLVQVMSPGHARGVHEPGNTVASEHGGERARLTDYHVRSVIAEYQQLRWTLFDVLAGNGVCLSRAETDAANAFIDEAIRESVQAFTLAHAALRERFVAALTHDLRTPLATAGMAAELIRHADELPRIHDLAGRIADNLARMDVMIRDLLDAVVFDSGERLQLHLAEFDITALAHAVCERQAILHGPRFAVDGPPVSGRWDRAALERALENLVGNAVKYGTPGSQVRVTVTSVYERMTLMVHNEGEAIPADQLEDIFQVFRRTSAALAGGRSGWGIGLPYVRSVAESHGGSISVDSAPARGTTFVLDLPVDAAPFQGAPSLGGT